MKGILPNETSDSEIASDLEPIKPSIPLRLKEQTVLEGGSVHLKCVIIGQPEPEVINKKLQKYVIINKIWYNKRIIRLYGITMEDPLKNPKTFSFYSKAISVHL